MSDQLLKFAFTGRRVRGELVRLDAAWRDMIAHHQYPPPVMRVLGEMVAAAALLATNIKFNGALVMQVYGDGPLQLLVVECQADLALRATAKVRDEPIADDISLRELVNRGGRGRFAITLDPKDPLPGQQPYQGVVPLEGDSVAEVLQTYMRQSEQLETRLWLASSDAVAAGLLLQRLPSDGGLQTAPGDDDAWEHLLALSADRDVRRITESHAGRCISSTVLARVARTLSGANAALPMHLLARADRKDAGLARSGRSRLDHR